MTADQKQQIKSDEKMTHKKTGLYIHIPFCVRKCNYCAFLSFASDKEMREAYAAALIRELEVRARAAAVTGEACLPEAQAEKAGTASAGTVPAGSVTAGPVIPKPVIETVYFGGGTPSVMETELIDAVMEAVRANFDLAPHAEITIEANPGTLGSSEAEILEKLRAYRAIGFNRLSMGVQSMDDERLGFLGRIHTSGDVRRDVKLARQAGFDNINLDLIFSVPGESGNDALRDAEALIALVPEHISCYSLQLEEGTPFYMMAESGEISEVSDEADRATYHMICDLLRNAGYEHYEISNFAKMPDGEGSAERAAGFDGSSISAETFSPFRSRHNSMYWDMSDYIGAGLGASGFTDGVRYKNISDMKEYIAAFGGTASSRSYYSDNCTGEESRAGDAAEETHLPSLEYRVNTAFDNISEAVFTGLRRRDGISFREAIEAYWRATDDGAFVSKAGNTADDKHIRSAQADTDSKAADNITDKEYSRLFWNIFADSCREAHEYEQGGLLLIDDRGLRLTERGIDISNGIMSLFV